jgi:hypothetical protein
MPSVAWLLRRRTHAVSAKVRNQDRLAVAGHESDSKSSESNAPRSGARSPLTCCASRCRNTTHQPLLYVRLRSRSSDRPRRAARECPRVVRATRQGSIEDADQRTACRRARTRLALQDDGTRVAFAASRPRARSLIPQPRPAASPRAAQATRYRCRPKTQARSARPQPSSRSRSPSPTPSPRRPKARTATRATAKSASTRTVAGMASSCGTPRAPASGASRTSRSAPTSAVRRSSRSTTTAAARC